MSTRTRPALARLRRRIVVNGSDSGVAMVTVLMVIMLVTALSATTGVIAVRNVQNANRDRQAGAALGASDAGVAQAIEYLRNNGAGGLTCDEATSSTSCTSNPQGFNNPTNPKLVDLSGSGCNANANDCAKVWIGVVSKFNPPVTKSGLYRIHSQGIFGGGPGARNTVVDVRVTPDKYPIGVFGATLSGNGGTSVNTESLFTTQCVSPRQSGSGNGTRFTGQDNYWGIPAAAHSTTHVSTSNNCGSNGYIQSSAAPCNTTTALSYDQTGDGGVLPAGSPCLVTRTDGSGQLYPDGACPANTTSTRSDGLCQTSAFTTTDLQRYGYRPRGLSDTQYAALKTRSKSMGLYNVGTGSLSTLLNSALTAGVAHPVVYWDCNVTNTACSPSSPTVAFSVNDLPANTFQTPPNTSPCQPNMNILTVVVAHGNLTFQGGNSTWTDASFFVPDGSFNANGGYNVLGTLFSNNLDLGGNQTFQLDNCFLTNFPGPVLSVTQVGFREDDSKDVG
jgi:hypothetical protein